ncbi:uncharacterized protein LOC121877415 [Homarus americanus]|uniref:uncharacterized protein LOC121877415 n=1 Tax=Homarus americanus TaxID=6706 RepID=UPI001C451FCC|nr:uncharacterized protein LOC121877415 [Homarus americanus]
MEAVRKRHSTSSEESDPSIKTPKLLKAGDESVQSGDNTPDDVFSILYNFVSQAGEVVLADVVKVLYSQNYIKSRRGTMPLFEYCVSQKHWKDQRISAKFGNDRHLLTCDITQQRRIEVNFAFKVIVELCGNGFDWLTPGCRNQIKLVKDYKYKICLKYGLSYFELASEVERFMKIVSSIYHEVGQQFKIDFKESLDIIFDKAKVISKDEASFKQVVNSNENIFLENKDVFKLIKAQRELKEYFQRLKVANPFTWLDNMWHQRYEKGSMAPMVVESIYTPLKIRDTGIKMDVKQLLTTTRIGQEEAIPSVLLLNGLHGSGKTSLCYHLMEDWCKGTRKNDHIENFDLVFLIEHSKVGSILLKNFMREKMLKKTCEEFEIEGIFQFMKRLDVLFIIDGYDEGTKETWTIVEEILEKFSNKRILLTTRPDCLADTTARLRNQPVNFLTVDIAELDDPAQTNIAKAIFEHWMGNTGEREKKLNDFLEYHHRGAGRKILDHLRFPLTAALYIAHWISHGMEAMTGTALHDALYELGMKQLGLSMGLHDPDILGKLTTELPYLLGRFAWKLLKTKRHTLDETMESEIESFSRTINVDCVEIVLPFLTCTFNHFACPTKRCFSFMNRPQQSYYAAKYLCSCIVTGKSRIQDLQIEINDWKEYPYLLLFLIGHLRSQNVMNLTLQQILNIIHTSNFKKESYSYWWNLCVESQGHKVVRTFIAETLPKFHWVLNQETVAPALKLLGSCPVELKSMSIDIPKNIDPYDIPEFLSLMENLSTVLKGRYNEDNPIEVKLHLWRNCENEAPQPSDKFLRSLVPWGVLVNFPGEFGEQEKTSKK